MLFIDDTLLNWLNLEEGPLEPEAANEDFWGFSSWDICMVYCGNGFYFMIGAGLLLTMTFIHATVLSKGSWASWKKKWISPYPEEKVPKDTWISDIRCSSKTSPPKEKRQVEDLGKYCIFPPTLAFTRCMRQCKYCLQSVFNLFTFHGHFRLLLTAATPVHSLHPAILAPSVKETQSEKNITGSYGNEEESKADQSKPDISVHEKGRKSETERVSSSLGCKKCHKAGRTEFKTVVSTENTGDRVGVKALISPVKPESRPEKSIKNNRKKKLGSNQKNKEENLPKESLATTKILIDKFFDMKCLQTADVQDTLSFSQFQELSTNVNEIGSFVNLNEVKPMQKAVERNNFALKKHLRDREVPSHVYQNLGQTVKQRLETSNLPHTFCQNSEACDDDSVVAVQEAVTDLMSGDFGIICSFNDATVTNSGHEKDEYNLPNESVTKEAMIGQKRGACSIKLSAGWNIGLGSPKLERSHQQMERKKTHENSMQNNTLIYNLATSVKTNVSRSKRQKKVVKENTRMKTVKASLMPTARTILPLSLQTAESRQYQDKDACSERKHYHSSPLVDRLCHFDKSIVSQDKKTNPGYSSHREEKQSQCQQSIKAGDGTKAERQILPAVSGKAKSTKKSFVKGMAYLSQAMKPSEILCQDSYAESSCTKDSVDSHVYKKYTLDNDKKNVAKSKAFVQVSKNLGCHVLSSSRCQEKDDGGSDKTPDINEVKRRCLKYNKGIRGPCHSPKLQHDSPPVISAVDMSRQTEHHKQQILDRSYKGTRWSSSGQVEKQNRQILDRIHKASHEGAWKQAQKQKIFDESKKEKRESVLTKKLKVIQTPSPKCPALKSRPVAVAKKKKKTLAERDSHEFTTKSACCQATLDISLINTVLKLAHQLQPLYAARINTVSPTVDALYQKLQQYPQQWYLAIKSPSDKLQPEKRYQPVTTDVVSSHMLASKISSLTNRRELEELSDLQKMDSQHVSGVLASSLEYSYSRITSPQRESELIRGSKKPGLSDHSYPTDRVREVNKRCFPTQEAQDLGRTDNQQISPPRSNVPIMTNDLWSFQPKAPNDSHSSAQLPGIHAGQMPMNFKFNLLNPRSPPNQFDEDGMTRCLPSKVKIPSKMSDVKKEDIVSAISRHDEEASKTPAIVAGAKKVSNTNDQREILERQMNSTKINYKSRIPRPVTKPNQVKGKHFSGNSGTVTHDESLVMVPKHRAAKTFPYDHRNQLQFANTKNINTRGHERAHEGRKHGSIGSIQESELIHESFFHKSVTGELWTKDNHIIFHPRDLETSNRARMKNSGHISDLEMSSRLTSPYYEPISFQRREYFFRARNLSTELSSFTGSKESPSKNRPRNQSPASKKLQIASNRFHSDVRRKKRKKANAKESRGESSSSNRSFLSNMYSSKRKARSKSVSRSPSPQSKSHRSKAKRRGKSVSRDQSPATQTHRLIRHKLIVHDPYKKQANPKGWRGKSSSREHSPVLKGCERARGVHQERTRKKYVTACSREYESQRSHVNQSTASKTRGCTSRHVLYTPSAHKQRHSIHSGESRSKPWSRDISPVSKKQHRSRAFHLHHVYTTLPTAEEQAFSKQNANTDSRQLEKQQFSISQSTKLNYRPLTRKVAPFHGRKKSEDSENTSTSHVSLSIISSIQHTPQTIQTQSHRSPILSQDDKIGGPEKAPSATDLPRPSELGQCCRYKYHLPPKPSRQLPNSDRIDLELLELNDVKVKNCTKTQTTSDINGSRKQRQLHSRNKREKQLVLTLKAERNSAKPNEIKTKREALREILAQIKRSRKTKAGNKNICQKVKEQNDTRMSQTAATNTEHINVQAKIPAETATKEGENVYSATTQQKSHKPKSNQPGPKQSQENITYLKESEKKRLSTSQTGSQANALHVPVCFHIDPPNPDKDMLYTSILNSISEMQEIGSKSSHDPKQKDCFFCEDNTSQNTNLITYPVDRLPQCPHGQEASRKGAEVRPSGLQYHESSSRTFLPNYKRDNTSEDSKQRSGSSRLDYLKQSFKLLHGYESTISAGSDSSLPAIQRRYSRKDFGYHGLRERSNSRGLSPRYSDEQLLHPDKGISMKCVISEVHLQGSCLEKQSNALHEHVHGCAELQAARLECQQPRRISDSLVPQSQIVNPVSDVLSQQQTVSMNSNEGKHGHVSKYHLTADCDQLASLFPTMRNKQETQMDSQKVDMNQSTACMLDTNPNSPFHKQRNEMEIVYTGTELKDTNQLQQRKGPSNKSSDMMKRTIFPEYADQPTSPPPSGRKRLNEMFVSTPRKALNNWQAPAKVNISFLRGTNPQNLELQNQVTQNLPQNLRNGISNVGEPSCSAAFSKKESEPAKESTNTANDTGVLQTVPKAGVTQAKQSKNPDTPVQTSNKLKNDSRLSQGKQTEFQDVPTILQLASLRRMQYGDNKAAVKKRLNHAKKMKRTDMIAVDEADSTRNKKNVHCSLASTIHQIKTLRHEFQQKSQQLKADNTSPNGIENNGMCEHSHGCKQDVMKPSTGIEMGCNFTLGAHVIDESFGKCSASITAGKNLTTTGVKTDASNEADDYLLPNQLPEMIGGTSEDSVSGHVRLVTQEASILSPKCQIKLYDCCTEKDIEALACPYNSTSKTKSPNDIPVDQLREKYLTEMRSKLHTKSLPLDVDDSKSNYVLCINKFLNSSAFVTSSNVHVQDQETPELNCCLATHEDAASSQNDTDSLLDVPISKRVMDNKLAVHTFKQPQHKLKGHLKRKPPPYLGGNSLDALEDVKQNETAATQSTELRLDRSMGETDKEEAVHGKARTYGFHQTVIGHQSKDFGKEDGFFYRQGTFPSVESGQASDVENVSKQKGLMATSTHEKMDYFAELHLSTNIPGKLNSCPNSYKDNKGEKTLSPSQRHKKEMSDSKVTDNRSFTNSSMIVRLGDLDPQASSASNIKKTNETYTVLKNQSRSSNLGAKENSAWSNSWEDTAAQRTREDKTELVPVRYHLKMNKTKTSMKKHTSREKMFVNPYLASTQNKLSKDPCSQEVLESENGKEQRRHGLIQNASNPSQKLLDNPKGTMTDSCDDDVVLSWIDNSNVPDSDLMFDANPSTFTPKAGKSSSNRTVMDEPIHEKLVETSGKSSERSAMVSEGDCTEVNDTDFQKDHSDMNQSSERKENTIKSIGDRERISEGGDTLTFLRKIPSKSLGRKLLKEHEQELPWMRKKVVMKSNRTKSAQLGFGNPMKRPNADRMDSLRLLTLNERLGKCVNLDNIQSDPKWPVSLKTEDQTGPILSNPERHDQQVTDHGVDSKSGSVRITRRVGESRKYVTSALLYNKKKRKNCQSLASDMSKDLKLGANNSARHFYEANSLTRHLAEKLDTPESNWDSSTVSLQGTRKLSQCKILGVTHTRGLDEMECEDRNEIDGHVSNYNDSHFYSQDHHQSESGSGSTATVASKVYCDWYKPTAASANQTLEVRNCATINVQPDIARCGDIISGPDLESFQAHVPQTQENTFSAFQQNHIHGWQHITGVRGEHHLQRFRLPEWPFTFADTGQYYWHPLQSTKGSFTMAIPIETRERNTNLQRDFRMETKLPWKTSDRPSFSEATFPASLESAPHKAHCCSIISDLMKGNGMQKAYFNTRAAERQKRRMEHSELATQNNTVSDLNTLYQRLQPNYNKANEVFHSNWVLANQNNSLCSTISIGNQCPWFDYMMPIGSCFMNNGSHSYNQTEPNRELEIRDNHQVSSNDINRAVTSGVPSTTQNLMHHSYLLDISSGNCAHLGTSI